MLNALRKRKNELYEKRKVETSLGASIIALWFIFSFVGVILPFLLLLIGELNFISCVFLTLGSLISFFYLYEYISSFEQPEVEKEIQMIELQLHEVEKIEDVKKICEKYKLKLVSL
jgi:hypothetical protein